MIRISTAIQLMLKYHRICHYISWTFVSHDVRYCNQWLYEIIFIVSKPGEPNANVNLN